MGDKSARSSCHGLGTELDGVEDLVSLRPRYLSELQGAAFCSGALREAAAGNPPVREDLKPVRARLDGLFSDALAAPRSAEAWLRLPTGLGRHCKDSYHLTALHNRVGTVF